MKRVDRLPICEHIPALRDCGQDVAASDFKHLPVLEGNNSAGPGSEQRQGCVGDGSVLVGRVVVVIRSLRRQWLGRQNEGEQQKDTLHNIPEDDVWCPR